MISPKERLLLVLNKKPVDRPPCICPGGMMNMITRDLMDRTGVKWPEAHSDPKMMADLAAGVYSNGGFENFGVPFCMTVEAEAMGAKITMGTEINEPRVTDYPLNSVTEYKKLKPIDISVGRPKIVLDAIRLLKEMNPDIPVIGNLTGPISLATSLLEPVIYYKEIYKRPEAAHELMGYITENLIVFGDAQIQAGADVLAISDPSGTGEILGSRSFRNFAIPYLNAILSGLESRKVGTIIHICGKLKSIYADLNELNSDVISFDAITSISQVVENLQDKVIMGNVSTLLLERATPETIREVSETCLKSGVDILAPACGIGPKTPYKNIQAMVEAVKANA